jgi:hypothetical protein
LTISLWIRPRTCTHYIANDSCACEYSLKLTTGSGLLRDRFEDWRGSVDSLVHLSSEIGGFFRF